MPVYSATQIPSAIYPGDTFLSINAELNTAYPTGTAAQKCAIAQNIVGGPKQISMQVEFSANPGVFEIDLQTADQDINGAYKSMDSTFNITTAVQTGGAGNYYNRVEVPVKALFCRAFVVLQTANACTITVRITG